MSPLQKILSPLSDSLGKILGGIDSRKAESIRQTYIFFIVILCIVGASIGYIKGKNSASKSGSQLAETTNRIFDFGIQSSREEVYEGTLEGNLQDNERIPDPAMQRSSAVENLRGEGSDGIIEAPRDREIKPGPHPIDNSSLAQPSEGNPKSADQGILDSDFNGLTENIVSTPFDETLIPAETPKNTSPSANTPQNSSLKKPDTLEPMSSNHGLAE